MIYNVKKATGISFFIVLLFLCLCSCGSKQQGRALSCSLTIDCTEVKEFMTNSDLKEILPENGIIYNNPNVVFYEGESVFDILMKTVKDNKIHISISGSKSCPYIEGLANLYEFDFGSYSGWIYTVDNQFCPYSCGQTFLKGNEVVVFKYITDKNSATSFVQ